MQRFNWSKGFTLIELMIVIAILAIIGAVVFSKGCSCAGSKEAATQAAHLYAAELGWKIVGVSCAETDSDNDGYISCTIRVNETEDSKPVEKFVECASGSWTSRTGGCKARMPGVLTSPMGN